MQTAHGQTTLGAAVLVQAVNGATPKEGGAITTTLNLSSAGSMTAVKQRAQILQDADGQIILINTAVWIIQQTAGNMETRAHARLVAVTGRITLEEGT